MTVKFEDFNLNPILKNALQSMKYENPTPIQQQAIPLALKGRDIMGSAQTGTGKTAAYSIPIINFLLENEKGSALVLTPTRELGKQVMDIMHQLLGKERGIKTAFLIGGVPMGKQYAQLTQKPRLIVGTPGRINDHLERGNIHMKDMRFLVLDETDRMLDMGFSVQIDRILKHMPHKRQTLMFSATLPDNIIDLSKKYLTNPERVAVGSTINPIKNIQQDILHVKESDKYDVLVEQLDNRKGSVIIFVKTKYSTERLAKRLNAEKSYDFEAEAIHGDLKQSRRDRVIKKMRAQEFRILVATDVIARGLDIPHIEHVINYDLPQVPEDYIHRIGRTARAGASGSALCLITPKDGRLWHAIEMLMYPDKKPAKGPLKPRRDKPRSGSDKNRNKKRGYPKKKDIDSTEKRTGKKRKDNKRKNKFGDKPESSNATQPKKRNDKRKTKPKNKKSGKPSGNPNIKSNAKKRPTRPNKNNGSKPRPRAKQK